MTIAGIFTLGAVAAVILSLLSCGGVKGLLWAFPSRWHTMFRLPLTVILPVTNSLLVFFMLGTLHSISVDNAEVYPPPPPRVCGTGLGSGECENWFYKDWFQKETKAKADYLYWLQTPTALRPPCESLVPEVCQFTRTFPEIPVGVMVVAALESGLVCVTVIYWLTRN